MTFSAKVVEKFSVKMLKEGEDQKIKTYNALCVCPGGAEDYEAVKERLESMKESSEFTITFFQT